MQYTNTIKMLVSSLFLILLIFLVPTQVSAWSLPSYDRCDIEKGSKDYQNERFKNSSYNKGSKDKNYKNSRTSLCDKESKGVSRTKYRSSKASSCVKDSYNKNHRGSKVSYSCDKKFKGSSCNRVYKNTNCTSYDEINTTGIVIGHVYEDLNHNKLKDINETGISGIEITILDAENNTFITYTDNNGTYMQAGVAEGEAIVTVNSETLPTDTELTAGDNPSIVIVVPAYNCDSTVCTYPHAKYSCNHDDNISWDSNCSSDNMMHRFRHNGNKCYNNNRNANNKFNTKCSTKDSINRYQNKYSNHNNHQNSNCSGNKTMNRYSYENKGYEHGCNHDNNISWDANCSSNDMMHRFRHRGNNCSNEKENRKRVCEHNCTIDNDTSPDSSNCELVYSEAGDDGYTYVTERQTGSICGVILIDNIGEGGIDVFVTTETETITVSTENNGTWCAYDLAEGTVIIDIDENTLPDNVERVIGEDNDSYPIIPEVMTDAGIDAFEISIFTP